MDKTDERGADENIEGVVIEVTAEVYSLWWKTRTKKGRYKKIEKGLEWRGKA